MPLTNYTELKAAVADWANRTDLTAKIVDSITLAEAVIFRELKLRAAETTVTGSTSGATIALPAGLGRIERLEIVSGSVKYTLDYTSPNGIEALTAAADRPTRYTVEGGAIRLISVPDGTYTYTLFYIPNFTALSAGNPTNWVLTNAPDVYLFGSLMQLDAAIKDPDYESKWAPLFIQSIKDVSKIDASARFPLSGGLQIKPRNAR